VTDANWKTAISDVASGQIRVRGYDITELMEQVSYAEAVYLLLKGELPGKAEASLMNAILVSSVDHGPTSPSVLATRTVISGGNSLNAAMAGGVLAIGDMHGGAIEQSAKILQEWALREGPIDVLAGQLADWLIQSNTRMPGLGHTLHQTDPRSGKLFEIAALHGYSGRHIELCQALEGSLARKVGKHLPVNINGATAAVISDMGFDWRIGKGFFIISRTAGLLAHAYEEMTREKPLRKLGPMPFTYDGPIERKID